MNLLSKSDSALKPIPSKILTWFYNSIFSVLVRSIFRLFGKTRPALKNQLQSKYRLKLYPDPFAPVEDHGCWFLCASWRSVSHDKRCPHGWSCQWKRGQPQCGLVKQCGHFASVWSQGHGTHCYATLDLGVGKHGDWPYFSEVFVYNLCQYFWKYNTIQLMVNWWLGLVVWIPGISLYLKRDYYFGVAIEFQTTNPNHPSKHL